MHDLINCMMIYEGGAKPKRKLTFDEVIRMR